MKLGLFDSGVGGLTVLHQFLAHGLKFEYLYLADTARAPFGTKSVEEIRKIALECIDFLLEKGADVVVSACNTAQAALKISGTNLGDRFFGILDFDFLYGFKKVGILATEATVKSSVYLEKLCAIGIEAIQQPCQALVAAIESCAQDNEIRNIIAGSIQPLMRAKVEAVILGCTHFPIVKHIFQELFENIPVLDPAALLAEKLVRILPTSSNQEAHVKFYVTGDDGDFHKKIKRYEHLIGVPYSIEKVLWGESAK